MNIILHIGQSKTGTTAIQSVLSDNRDLLQQQGILYPDVFLKGVPAQIINHNAFANALLGYDFYPRLSADEYYQQFMEQYAAGDYHTLLLSAESFFGGRPYLWELGHSDDYYKFYEEKLKVLKRYFGASSIKIICYLRRQDKWLESVIPQIIRYEGTLGKKVYFSDEQIAELQGPRMNYEGLIGLWDSVLIPSEICLKPYDPSEFKNGNVIYDFASQIGIEPNTLKSIDKPRNPHKSWSPEFIEVKKKLNQTPRSRYSEDTVIDLINKLDRHNGSGRKYEISNALVQKITDICAAGNSNLSQKYCNGAELFSPARLDREDHLTSEKEIENATRLFEQSYNSLAGRKVYFLNIIKRVLRKHFPALHAFLAYAWRKLKKLNNTSNHNTLKEA